LGARQARRRPGRCTARQPARAVGRGGSARTVIINLQQRASEGKRTATGGSRLPFYVRVLSGAENGAHGSTEPRTKTAPQAFAHRPSGAQRPGQSARPSRHGEAPDGEVLWLRVAHTRAHTHVHSHARARTHSHTRARAQTASQPELWPGVISVRHSALALSSFLKDLTRSPLCPSETGLFKIVDCF
jgi:hypothetical protein